LIGGESAAVNTRAVSMWVQTVPPWTGSARWPFRNL